MKKLQQYEMALREVNTNLKDLSKYHKIFLATMLLRKIRHPEEDLREIISKTMLTMVKRYGKKDLSQISEEEENIRIISMQILNKTVEEYGKQDLIQTSTDKCLDELEMKLDSIDIPKEWINEGILTEETVSGVFRKLTEKLQIQINGN